MYSMVNTSNLVFTEDCEIDLEITVGSKYLQTFMSKVINNTIIIPMEEIKSVNQIYFKFKKKKKILLKNHLYLCSKIHYLSKSFCPKIFVQKIHYINRINPLPNNLIKSKIHPIYNKIM